MALWPSLTVCHTMDADWGCQIQTYMSVWSIYRVGQNLTYTPYMTVYLVISLPKMPYTHRIYMVLANPIYIHMVFFAGAFLYIQSYTVWSMHSLYIQSYTVYMYRLWPILMLTHNHQRRLLGQLV